MDVIIAVMVSVVVRPLLVSVQVSFSALPLHELMVQPALTVGAPPS